MKVYLIIFSIAGLCFGLDSGHHLKYKYSASFKVGIPDDGDQVAGLAFRAVVDVFVEDNDGIAVLKLSDVSTLSFNEELGIGEDIDFTDERFKHFEDEDLRRIVEQPFRANLRDSEPFAIEYEETNHRWLSNVRKGIALMLKNEILKGNFETQEKDSVSSLFHQGHLVNNFVVEEETLLGICKAAYKIHQIPVTLFIGTNDLTPSRQEGARNDLWHVSRSIDFDNCKEIVSLNMHTTNNRKHKHQKLRFTRTSASTYVLRGSPGHFDVYSVLTEGATTYPVSLFNDNEEAQSTVKQKLVLIDENQSEVIPELGTNLKRSTTWMHEIWSSFQKPKESKSHPWIVYNNKNEPDLGFELFGTKKYDADQTAAAKANILKLIEEASKKLTDLNQEAEDAPSETISETLELATFYFRVLKREDILKIFYHFLERKVGVEWQLVINAAAASGFNEAFEAIMDCIEKDQIDPFQIFTAFMTLSRNSFGSLNVSRLMDFLLDQEKPSEYLLNFAHYLSEYCIHKTHTYSPVAGEAECDSLITTKRFIPYLKDIIYNEDLTWERAYAVKVLDLLRSGFTFEIVSPLIDGRMKSSAALKAMAVRALENWHIYPENIMRSPIIDLLTDVYSDVSQDLHVRIAALLTITSWQPTTKFWYDLALRTWKDPSNEFASFASTLIKIYAEQNLPTLEKQSKGAAFALKFSKPPSATFQSSYIVLSKEFFNRQAKIAIQFGYFADGYNFATTDFMFSILTNFGDLLTVEDNVLYGERITIFNETVKKDRSNIPDAKELLEKLYNEIQYAEHKKEAKRISDGFLEIFNDAFTRSKSLTTYLPYYLRSDKSDPNILYFGTHLYLMDKSDLLPNELGIPFFTFNALPTTVGFTTKLLPRKSGYLPGSQTQSLFKLSSVYSRGISVFLPWNFQFSSAIIRSNLEIIIPIGKKERRNLGTEGPLRSWTTNYEIVYKKKFPLFRISNTPITATYDLDPKAENGVINYEVIKQLNVKEKRINELNPPTGIKYDLVMRADTPSSFGLRDILKFPEIPFRVWSLYLYVDPDESETKQLLITKAIGSLSNADQDEDSEEKVREKNAISISDNFKERSQKIRKLLRNGLIFGDTATYLEWKFNFIGSKRQHEIFFTLHEGVTGEVADPNHRYSFKSLGFTTMDQSLIPKYVCINLHNTHIFGPAKYYYDSNSAQQKTRAKEYDLQVFLGCNEKIFSTNVVYNISEERSTNIIEYCKANYGEEKCFVENDELLSFDDILVTFHEEDNNATKDAKNFIQTLLQFSHLKEFGLEIPKQNQQFNLRRNTHNGNWDLFLKYESEDVYLSTFSSNIILKFLTESSTTLPYIDIFMDTFSQELKPKCTLTNNFVETFDGVNFENKLSNCWTLASQTETSDRFDNVFLVRKPQHKSSIPDFKYIIFQSGTEIELSNNELKVNGLTVHKIKEDESDSSNTVEDRFIFKRGNTYLIYAAGMTGRPNIIVSKDKIEYYKEFKYHMGNGICGNGDGETIPELIGPKKCVYNDGQIFTASWTGSSENCDSATLKEYRNGVEDYQTKCEPFYGQLKESPMNHRCLLFGYKPLATSENRYCISIRPVLFCSSDCDIKKVETVKWAYKCWPKEEAPERLRTSIENKVDIVTDPITADPVFYEYLSTEMAKNCKRF